MRALIHYTPLPQFFSFPQKIATLLANQYFPHFPQSPDAEEYIYVYSDAEVITVARARLTHDTACMYINEACTLRLIKRYVMTLQTLAILI